MIVFKIIGIGIIAACIAFVIAAVMVEIIFWRKEK